MRWVPTKSRTVQAPCPCALRRPRPSCWRNSVGLSVGRSIRIVSTSGTSTPSLKRSTEKTHPDPAGRQVAQRRLAFGSGAVAPDGDGGDAVAVEVVGHELGVLDAHAEPEAAHRRDVRVLGDLLDDRAAPRRRSWCRGCVSASTS